MNKKIGFFKLALSFAGCFLGAGYVSGQELWQFFGSFGAAGVFGLALAVLLISLSAVIILRLARMTGSTEIDRLMIPWELPVLRYALTALNMLLLFGICTIMSAGVGAMLEQLFGVPLWIGSAVFCAVIAVLSYAGIRGMVSAFSVSVPVLVGVTLAFGVYSAVKYGIHIPESSGGANPLVGSWLISAVLFCCLNVFGTVGMLAPLNGHIKSERAELTGISCGALLLIIIAFSVLTSVFASPGYTSAELPMLALAQDMGTSVGLLFGFLLLLAMFGTALSSLVALSGLLCLKSKKLADKKLLMTAVIAVFMFGGSLFGFGGLIGTLYPLYGYLGLVFIVLMYINYFKVKKSLRT